jgi:activator of HSP90 ATPase
METVELLHEVQFEAPLEEVYTAFLNSEQHTNMINADTMIKAEEGAQYTAGDGYIHGEILVLVPLRKIKKTWIANEEDWPEGHESQVVFDFHAYEGGTRLEFRHLNIPKKVAPKVNLGWVSQYWKPAMEYFSSGEGV